MQQEPLYVANRVVAIVLPSTPFVEWINAADPFPANAGITLDDARDEPSAFLVPTDSSDDPDQPGKRWIQRNWKAIFEHLLGDWYTDPDLWPRNRTIRMFREWCEVRIHPTVLDCAVTPLEYDD
jgi:hypothetical protein